MDQTEPLDARDLMLEEYRLNEIDKSYTDARDRHLSTIDRCISNTQTALYRISADIKARETGQLSRRLHQYTAFARNGLAQKLAQDSLKYFVNKYGVNLAAYQHESDVKGISALTNIRRINQDEVEGMDFIFRYPSVGPGYFVVRCDRREEIHRFERNPFLPATGPGQKGLSRLVSHFNLVSMRCHLREDARLLSADEIVRTFGYRVVDHDDNDVDTNWVERSNTRLISNNANTNTIAITDTDTDTNNHTTDDTTTDTTTDTDTDTSTNTTTNRHIDNNISSSSSSRWSPPRLRTRQRNRATAAAAAPPTTAIRKTPRANTRKRKTPATAAAASYLHAQAAAPARAHRPSCPGSPFCSFMEMEG
ncbi:uncharacterized protein C8A04DRAFT_26557 [Dichotomopilus funicola]|uniref:Uncharacterized protein n=1 Tax=Dichotomopilus funicola TaxID=1934379 RepID=A0AAN6V673_9PEZI|nr:hypothetical protein C8A04DRAFT_26557 [Dichotomopilus funicola]